MFAFKRNFQPPAIKLAIAQSPAVATPQKQCHRLAKLFAPTRGLEFSPAHPTILFDNNAAS
ncbi:MAG: hypothetical protein ACOH2J_05440 [Allorhizobium sp.]